MTVLEQQVGGRHYKGQAFQPVHVWIRRCMDAFVGSAVKYVMRYRGKGGKADLEKAIHFIRLREELLSQSATGIDLIECAQANGMDERETAALVALGRYDLGEITADEVIAAIQAIIDAY